MPPVERIFTPCAARAWAKGTTPDLSETLIKALLIGATLASVMGLPLGSDNSRLSKLAITKARS